MQDDHLKIVIAGVPPGVKVGVFNENEEKRTKERTILLEEAANHRRNPHRRSNWV